MQVKIESNVLTVVSGIDAKALKEAGKVVVKDGKGNQKFSAGFASGKEGSVADFAINFNSIVDGKAALTMVFGTEETAVEIKKATGTALVAANQYLGQIAVDMATQTSAIEAIFANEPVAVAPVVTEDAE